eukprot:414736-Rhodomonas_salina.2
MQESQLDLGLDRIAPPNASPLGATVAPMAAPAPAPSFADPAQGPTHTALQGGGAAEESGGGEERGGEAGGGGGGGGGGARAPKTFNFKFNAGKR